MAGVADEMRRVDADLRQRALVFLLQIAVEQQIGVGWTMQPAVGGNLALELAGAPAGVAEEEPAAPPRERRGFAGSTTVDPLKASKKAQGKRK